MDVQSSHKPRVIYDLFSTGCWIRNRDFVPWLHTADFTMPQGRVRKRRKVSPRAGKVPGGAEGQFSLRKRSAERPLKRSTSMYHPCRCRSQMCSPFHQTPPPKTSFIAFYTHIVVYKCFPCPCGSKNMPYGTIRAHLPTVTPHCAEPGSAVQTGS